MRATWLGWAGVAIEDAGARLLIDPLLDPAALYAALGPAAAGVRLPEVVDPGATGVPAVAALVTHLHRDHADAGALAGALAPGAPVYIPADPASGGEREPRHHGAADRLPPDAAVRQAHAELAGAGLRVVTVTPWQRLTAGPFTITALPAADGTGDPQVSWAVAGPGGRIVHAGDTLFHGWWWEAAAAAGPFDLAFMPVNGAHVQFPWRRPASPRPAVMTPEEATAAARMAGAAALVPIHHGGFDLEPWYQETGDILPRVQAAARELGLTVRSAAPGESFEVASVSAGC